MLSIQNTNKAKQNILSDMQNTMAVYLRKICPNGLANTN